MPLTCYIRQAEALKESLSAFNQQPFLALDTEFIRINTFYPIFGLLQIGNGDGEWLIDPLAVTDLSPLCDLLGPKGPIKVMHACSEDLEVLNPLLPEGLGEVHDTQIAMAFLGQGLQIGYQRALQDVLQIEIPKDASRSDWLQRPLTEHQLQYAALDVRHLPLLYQTLRERLQQQDVWEYYRQECAEVCRLGPSIDPDRAWLDHGNAWRLGPRNRAALQLLMAWREREAVQRNVPRGHLLKPTTLFELAYRMPAHNHDLLTMVDINPRVARQEADAILAMIDQARQIALESCPPPVAPPLPREISRVFDHLKRAIVPVAESLHLPGDVLWRKRLAEKVVLTAIDVDIDAGIEQIKGWRAPSLQPVMADVLRQHDEFIQSCRAVRRQVGAETTTI
ncbi:MAG: ribonuclease D [Moraxellaceae bacterium]|nr:ribonuclease D [Moraxellaceae bacterium]MDZ4387396.1 ribonuclease D [Moraxellaceae bacterium]